MSDPATAQSPTRADGPGGPRTARPERVVWLAGLVFALVVIAATLGHVTQLRHEMLLETESRTRTLSRILAKEVDRGFTAVVSVLDQIDEPIAGVLARGQLDAAGRLLESVPRQHPLLREVAVVGGDGRVLASSSARSVGLDVSGYDFYARPRAGALQLGVPKQGRTFARQGSPGEGTPFARSGFLTLARAIGPAARDEATSAGDGRQPVIVAVIGADSLINDLRFIAADDTWALSLYRYDGQLLAASSDDPLARHAAHPIFTRFLPDRENGAFVDDDGGAGARWLAHFDTAADYPVVVDVRTPEEAALARWRRELLAPLGVMAAIIAAIAFYTRLIGRALHASRSASHQATTQELRLRNILDTAADGIVTIDSQGVIREFNRAAESIFACTAAQAIGQPLSSLLPMPHAMKHQGYVERYLRTGEAHVIGRGRTLQTVRRDGRPMEIHLAVSEVEVDGERLFTGIVRDITEIRQAEERFRTLFQRSGEPHLLFDDTGLTDCNESALSLLGATTRAQLQGRHLRDLAPSVQHPHGSATDAVLAGAIAEARRLGVKRTLWNARALDGRHFTVEMTLTPLSLSGHEAMLVAWHDVSERQRYENDLRAARDAAESAAQTKASFLAMMSHELRTPMTGIIGMSELLSDTRLSDEQQGLVRVLRNSAHSLLTVLNDVLDFSKIEAGRLTLEQMDFEPAGVAGEVLALLAATASGRGNTLVADWRELTSLAVRGDPTRLRQILFNLVGNAIKFTERGRITVSIRALSPDRGAGADPSREATDAPTRRLRFEVSDTGVGIPAEVLPQLFTPFQQADSSTTRRFGGTGLGLAICRHLVRAMGGEIGVDSTPGEGSTFWFTIALPPAQHAPAAVRSDGAAQASASAPPTRTLRILLAEDNPTNQLLVTTRLRRSGHEVDVANNGTEAVARASAADYDVILMDMQMPELDGAGATRCIRALAGPRGQVPIIALTADALPEFREKYMNAGLSDYLTKPIDWDALARALARHAPASAEPATPAAAIGHATPAASPPRVEDPLAGVATVLGRLDEPDVSEIRDAFGADVFETAIALYWPKAAEDLAACRQAIYAVDQPGWRAAAHGLKGASANMGFVSLAAAAAALEKVPASEPADAASALDALVDVYLRTQRDWGVAEDDAATLPLDAAATGGAAGEAPRTAPELTRT